MRFKTCLKTAMSWLPVFWMVCTVSAHAQPANLGFAEQPATAQSPEIALYYPSSEAQQRVQRGPFALDLAMNGAYSETKSPRPLIVFSHGSGGSPWPVADLARAFVDAGYVVAIPTHDGDNWRDMSKVGPETWKLRPIEISRALDTLATHPQWAARLNLKRVGVYGMSAGGLTALTLAGGRWSSGNFMRHCLANMEKDFNACVGLATHLRGNVLDGLKIAAAKAAHRSRFDDDMPISHTDARIAAVLAHVPMAAPFDMASFSGAGMPLGILPADKDNWLHPQFHSDRVLAACKRCVRVMDLPQAGHGSLFSPWPQDFAASLTPLLVDPPGFDRGQLPQIYAKMVAFFQQHLATQL